MKKIILYLSIIMMISISYNSSISAESRSYPPQKRSQ